MKDEADFSRRKSIASKDKNVSKSDSRQKKFYDEKKKSNKFEAANKKPEAWKSATPKSKAIAKQPEKKSNKALADMESFLQTLKDNKKKGIAGVTAPEKDSKGGKSGGPVIRRTFNDPLSGLKN